tara:strand:- start:435 stop:545 length:111 start_codon:yes stop_codon:yes gene_type:complete
MDIDLCQKVKTSVKKTDLKAAKIEHLYELNKTGMFA